MCSWADIHCPAAQGLSHPAGIPPSPFPSSFSSANVLLSLHCSCLVCWVKNPRIRRPGPPFCHITPKIFQSFLYVPHPSLFPALLLSSPSTSSSNFQPSPDTLQQPRPHSHSCSLCIQLFWEWRDIPGLSHLADLFLLGKPPTTQDPAVAPTDTSKPPRRE